MSKNSAEHNYRMAFMFYRTERYADALFVLDQISRDFPDNKNILYGRAKCLAKLGRYSEARVVCARSVELYNDPRTLELGKRLENLEDIAPPRVEQAPTPVHASTSAPSEAAPNIPEDAGRLEMDSELPSTMSSSGPPDLGESEPSGVSTTGPELSTATPEVEPPFGFGLKTPPDFDFVTGLPSPAPLDSSSPPIDDKPLVQLPPEGPPGAAAARRAVETVAATVEKVPLQTRYRIAASVGGLIAFLFLFWWWTNATLHFPEDRSLGMVQVCSRQQLDEWTRVGAAQGKVRVPREALIALTAKESFRDRDLEYLRGLPVRKLDLSGSRVTDRGLPALRSLYELRELYLDRTAITDQGVSALKHLSTLEKLSIGGTKITSRGLGELRKVLANCEVMTSRVEPERDPADVAAAVAPAPVPARPVAAQASPAPAAPPAPVAAPPSPTPSPQQVESPPAVPPATPPPQPIETPPPEAATAVPEVPSPSPVPSAPPEPTEEPPGERLLSFALGQLVGDLFVRPWGSRDHEAWEPLGPARGRVKTPAAREARLVVRVGSSELKALDLLGPEDLQSLDLHLAHVTDEGMAHVARLIGLRELSLSRAEITDAGMAHVAGLIRLRTLEIPNARGITDAGLAHLRGLDALERLSLRGSSVTGKGLAHIAGLRRLAELDLTAVTVRDDDLAHLARLESLRTLQLEQTAVAGSGLSHLAKLSCLESLNLMRSGIGNSGLGHLKGLSQVKRLYLAGPEINDAGLASLSSMSGLEMLQLVNTSATPEGIEALKKALPRCLVTASGGAR